MLNRWYVKFLLILSILQVVVLNAQTDYKELRSDMVEYQIRRRGISDTSVLSAMETVERHRFVPADIAGLAYNDSPLSIGYGQTISQPYIVAFMTEILHPEPGDRILEVGTGSGYQAAVLAQICDSVFTIEVVPQLGRRAESTLQELGYTNIRVRVGDGYQGWPDAAPFDAIIVTCAPTHIPQPLQDQLREGGRMIIPVGERYVQELVLLTKKEGKIRKHSVLPVLFVPMVDEEGEKY